MVGDGVIAADGTLTSIVAVRHKGPLPNFRFECRDGATAESAEGQVWRVSNPNWRGHDVEPKSLELGRLVLRGFLDARGQPFFDLPIPQAADYDAGLARPVDPYLLGLLLGDGNLTSGAVRFSSGDEEILESVRRLLPEGYFLVPSTSRKYDYSISRGLGVTRGGSGLIAALFELGVMGRNSHHKRVPMAYKEAPKDVRISLLQGLMDADGTASKRRGHGPSFTTASRRLADDVLWLVRSLGGISTRRDKVTPVGHYYNLTASLPGEIVPFRLARKRALFLPRSQPLRRPIIRVIPSGIKPMQSIVIAHASQLYVTDNFIVTQGAAQVKPALKAVDG